MLGSLFATISKDSRHKGCHILDERKVGQRLYNGFGMALARVGAETGSSSAAGVGMAWIKKTASAPKPMLPTLPLVHLMRLQYSSTLIDADAEAGRQSISRILEGAMAFNAKHEIGGLLCFNPVTLRVTQVLEGHAPTVLDLFDRISIDSRHKDVVLTSQELVLSTSDLRFHASWGMMQTETRDDERTLLDLAGRLGTLDDDNGGRQPAWRGDGHTGKVIEEALRALKARRQERIDELLHGGPYVVETTPMAKDKMSEQPLLEQPS